MTDALSALMAKYSPSSETLPANDPREKAIAHLESMIRDLIAIANDKCKADEALRDLARNPTNADDLISAATLAGKLEERFYNLRDQINAAARRYNQDEHLHIFVAYTANGIPCRVRKTCKTEPWEPCNS